MSIEARVTFSEALLARGAQFQKDTWKTIRWLIIIGTSCQILAVYEKLGARMIFTFLVIAVVTFLVIPKWQEKKARKELAMHPWNGKEVRFVFANECIEVLAPAGDGRIEMRHISKASQDERGILVSGPKVGSVWIPTEAFQSAEEKKSAFEFIRTALKKKG